MANPRFIRTAAVVTVGAISAFGLAACSSSDDTGSGDSTSGEAVTIEYMHRLDNGADMATVAEITERWNTEHPDIQVKTTKFDGAATDMILKLETDVKAGNAPCLAQVGYSEAPQLYVKGLLMDVTEHAEKYKDNFSAGAYAGMRVGDVVVGLPQDVGPLVYFYNEAEFEKLGLTPPTTLDELNADSATAAAAGKYITAFSADEATHWLAAQSAAAGDTWFSTEGDEWVVDTEGEGSQVVAALWQGLPPPSTTRPSSVTSAQRGRRASCSTPSTAPRPRASGASRSCPTSALASSPARTAARASQR